MGRLYYSTNIDAIEIPDRVLAHLRTLTTTKLRRSESFTASFCHSGGRSTIWLHCSIPLRFEFDSAEPEALDREYLEELARSASASGGVVIDLTDSEVADRGPEPLRVAASHLGRAA
ncbi:hypothetical protein [Microbacterium thalassium]|uniref:DUF7882 domain-containing protein n=1 Tax=Microbacterium thalassium TaxID=362649 RepID=A0A7X0KU85_9MICO|nr:hypothetical protein [Microbacterium thalassium]MBB6390843.1 hypothetical protein [Microbacterium thalassium]GLK25951.1 hypothetical protein GCM10017607_32700 [Microbacterium thalassium]